MRTVLAIVTLVALLSTAVVAGCVSGLSTSNFTISPTAIGWRVGDDAVFIIRFDPQGASVQTYTIDPVFAVSEVKFEQDGLHFWGDYDTKNAVSDLQASILSNGSPVSNYTLASNSPEVQLRVHVPSISDGQYHLDVDLFKVGWVKSDLFRVANG
ncbi:MAG: hypothetical protein ACYDDF_00100 [Thermoplasmatota archaeon]